MERIYTNLLRDHFLENRQMAFVSGPRQVGKTTTSQAGDEACLYANWDNQADRLAITKGPDNIIRHFGLDKLKNVRAKVVFDEIHKYSKWKTFLKGYFDGYGENLKTIVTGSARLNIYKRGSDSLMGRYFLYRMHPLSLGEIMSPEIRPSEISLPTRPPKDAIAEMLAFSGFPEPFLKANKRFYNRWKRLRLEQLFNEDLRDLTNIQEIGQIEILAELLRNQSGALVNFSSLARDINVSVDTIRRWVTTLESLYYCFIIRPWFTNVPKSLRKQPKVYLWDWSMVLDTGARNENFVASHLLKAVHLWTDAGFGDYNIHFLRDKQKREVDFLITRDGRPWFLVEVKSSATSHLSKSLVYFKETLGLEHAFQIDLRSPFVEEDCFAIKRPIKVPAATLLAQLV